MPFSHVVEMPNSPKTINVREKKALRQREEPARKYQKRGLDNTEVDTVKVPKSWKRQRTEAEQVLPETGDEVILNSLAYRDALLISE